MKKLALGLATASLMAAGSVQAQFVTGGGTFNPLTAPALNNDGTPFWDNKSTDGTRCNIGYVLLGTVTAAQCDNETSSTGAFGILASGGEYYSDGGGVTPFMFSGPTRITILNTIAGANSEIGFFTKTDGLYNFNAFTATSKSSTGSTFIIPGGMFGLYISAGRLSDGCRADTGCSDADGIAALQQHALFRGADGKYYVGMEDRNAEAGGLNDRDYNDVILQVTPVPEPMSMALLATGLLGMGGVNVFRRRRARTDA